MKTFKKINSTHLVGILVGLLLSFSLPQTTFAQRFSHGGGGGGRPSGGGGGGRSFNGGGGHEMGNRENHPVPVMHNNIGGGGRDMGNHNVGYRNEPNRGFRNNEGVYHHVYGNHAYAFHAYHPYIWGPRWHPFGYFMGSLAADAFLFSIAGQQYYYDYGVYYQPSGNGYAVVAPPIGAVVSYLPDGYVTVQVGDALYYYYGGAFYISMGNSYRVVPAPAGAIVYEIPEGAAEQVINGINYLLYNNTYYLPISQNGQDAYEVVEVN